MISQSDRPSDDEKELINVQRGDRSDMPVASVPASLRVDKQTRVPCWLINLSEAGGCAFFEQQLPSKTTDIDLDFGIGIVPIRLIHQQPSSQFGRQGWKSGFSIRPGVDTLQWNRFVRSLLERKRTSLL